MLSQDAWKALKAYNTEAINRFHQRKVHNTEVMGIPQDDPPEPPVPDNSPSDLPESDLEIPDNRNLPLSLGRVKNVMKGYHPPTSMGLPITLITHLFLEYKLTKLYDVT